MSVGDRNRAGEGNGPCSAFVVFVFVNRLRDVMGSLQASLIVAAVGGTVLGLLSWGKGAWCLT